MKDKYTAFGVNIESELELSEFSSSESPADVAVVFGKVPERLDNPAAKTPWYEAKAGELLLRVDSIAKFYVANGCRIVIEPANGADGDDIRVFLLETVISALLGQRGLLALHGSTALINGKAVAILGNSSVGKTSVALALYDKGIPILSDEVCALGRGRGGLVVYPGAPCLHVWQDTLDTSGRDVNGFAPIRRGLHKYSFPLRERLSANPVELSRIFILNNHNREEILVEVQRGGEKLENLLRQASFAEVAPDRVKYFKICTATAIFPVIRLNFNRIPGNAARVADLILKESFS